MAVEERVDRDFTPHHRPFGRLDQFAITLRPLRLQAEPPQKPADDGGLEQARKTLERFDERRCLADQP